MSSRCNPSILPSIIKNYDEQIIVVNCDNNPTSKLITQPTRGTFSFLSNDGEIFMKTRPVVIKPIPMDIQPEGPCNFNFKRYAPQLFTSSNIYLDSPIWRRPLENTFRINNLDYRRARYDGIYDIHRLILEDMKEMNK